MNSRSAKIHAPAEDRLHRLDKTFAVAVSLLHERLELLLSTEPFEYRFKPKRLPTHVVYLFSEGGASLYVGRTRKFSQRLGNHCRAGSRANQSSFAFKLACEVSGIEQTRYSGPNTRDKMMENPSFVKTFSEAKNRLNQMQIRYVEESDTIRQTLLEVYCAVALKTPYNSFSTH